MARHTTSIALLGDIVLDAPDPDFWLSGIASVTNAADAAIGHLEVPHTDRGRELKGDVPAPGAPPAHLDALARAGITAVSLAGNHIADRGAEGIADTVAGLARLGIAHAGAGVDREAAFRPAFLRAGSLTVALLSYNCVGPEAGWAGTDSAGCAYLPVQTLDGAPVAPMAALEGPAPEALARLREDIPRARAEADLVVVALHKGLVHMPARLAPYERPLAQACVEAGADAVAGHHAHIVQAVEFHLGRPIFHGLGNGCVVTSALSPDQSHPARAEWARRRKALFGFEPDPAYTLAPFHPEAVNAMIGRLEIAADGELRAGFVPMHVEAPGRPVLAEAGRAQEIAAYVERITAQSGLPGITCEPEAGWVRLS